MTRHRCGLSLILLVFIHHMLSLNDGVLCLSETAIVDEDSSNTDSRYDSEEVGRNLTKISQVNICCAVILPSPESATEAKNLCPKGWVPHNEQITFCHPTIQNICPDFSLCILSPVTGKFVCCDPENQKPSKISALSKRESSLEKNNDGTNIGHTILSSVPPFSLACSRIELVNGRVRRCSARAYVAQNHCGPGFICRRINANKNVDKISSHVRKRKKRRGICCDESDATFKTQRAMDVSGDAARDEPLFRCPNTGQIPYLVDNRNVFCNVGRGDCPAGSLCQSATNSANMYICCRSAADAPQCPAHTSPQPAPIGFVPCDLLRPNQCRAGYLCVTAVNHPAIALCCSRATINRIICPNQQALYLEAGRPQYCSLNQQAPCPTGFACQEVVGQFGVRVCCSLPVFTVCPTGYSPSIDYYSGSIINCSPSELNVCPLDSQCLQAPNRAGTFLCCKSTAAPRVCAHGQHALLRPNTNQLETCTGPSASCSTSSFTCQFSPVVSAYVCCGRPKPTILCAEGRETYAQEAGKTFVCDPMVYPRDCPAGFECSHSNLGNVHVCCKVIQTSPIEPDVTFPETRFPSPMPFLPHQTATFRPPVDEITCPIGWSAFEDSRGAHHFCLDALDMSCPQGFSCAQSSITGIFMCCRLASTIQCPKAYSTLLVNGAPRLCSLGGASGASQSSPVSASSAQQPPLAGSGVCTYGYACMQSSVPAVYVCCSAATRGDLMCRDGRIPAYLGQFVRTCAVLGSVEGCPPTYICTPSDRPGLNICCHYPPAASLSSAKRMARQASVPFITTTVISALANVCGNTALEFLASDGRPIECNSHNPKCPTGYNCMASSLADGRYFCCQIAHCPNTPAVTTRRCIQEDDCSSPQLCTRIHSAHDIRLCCDDPNDANLPLQPLLSPLPSAPVIAMSPQHLELERRCHARCTLIVGGGA